MQLPPNTPILVGVKTLTQRLDDPTAAKDALELLVDAANACLADALSSKKISERLDAIVCMKSLVPMENPSQLLAERIGATAAKTVLAEVGVLQQSTFDWACNAILKGAGAVLVTGTETGHRKLRAKIAGIEIDNPPASSNAPDEIMEPETEIVHPLEVEMGLYTAPAHYSLLENAFGKHKNLQPAEQRLATGELWSRFNKIAAQNPFAAFPEPLSAEEIAIPNKKNRAIAGPYNKWNCSQINVDQASALLFMSVQKAEELGVPEANWVFPQASAVSNYMAPILKRKEMHRCQGFEIVGRAALEASSKSIQDIDYFDLYSCFPIAVWIQAQELGLDINQALTVTGGMSFSGGPLNSYVLGSLVRMAEVLRSESLPKFGLVTSISGMITKQGAGIWSTQPPEELPRFLDLSKEVAEATPICEVQNDYIGVASVASSTLLYNRDGEPERAVCVADVPDGLRTMAFSTQSKILSLMADENHLGRLDNHQIEISATKEFTLT